MRYSTCECAIGRDKCHHMAALLIWVEKNVSRTDVECVWKRAKTPKMDEIAAKSVLDDTIHNTRLAINLQVMLMLLLVSVICLTLCGLKPLYYVMMNSSYLSNRSLIS